MTGDFRSHVPAWRIRKLRRAIDEAREEGRRRIAGPEGEHRALRRVRAAAMAAAAPVGGGYSLRRAARLAARVEARHRGPILTAIADSRFDGSAPARGAVKRVYGEVQQALHAQGLPAPKYYRWRIWLSYKGYIPWPRSMGHLGD